MATTNLNYNLKNKTTTKPKYNTSSKCVTVKLYVAMTYS